MANWYQVGRPWLQLPARSVCSICAQQRVHLRHRERCGWRAPRRGRPWWRAARCAARPARGSRRTRASRAAPSAASPARRGRRAARAPRGSRARAGPRRPTSKPRLSSSARARLRLLDLLRGGGHRDRHQQRLRRQRRRVERVLQPLVDDALVRRVHVDDHEARRVLREDVDAVQLREREPERGRLARARAACASRAALVGHRGREERLVRRARAARPRTSAC